MKNFEYKKSLGQNFLIDQNIIRKIVNSIDIEDDSLIIEIGPGSGALTKELVKLNSNIISFEIDERLRVELNKLEEENNNLSIVYGDFLKVDLKEFLSTKKYNKLFFVANLPYYITTSIINKVINEVTPYEMIFMVQKEVADRFSAAPNNREYSSISVFLQYYYEISKVAIVSKNCFIPRPEVDSTVIKFKRNDKDYNVKDEEKFFKLVKDSFKFKRKNLRNNLKGYNLDKINEVLSKYNKDLTCRAESLSLEEFIKISNNLD